MDKNSTTERFEKKKELGWYQWYTLFTINIILPWLFWDIIELLIIPIPFVSIFIIWTLVKIISRKSNKKKFKNSSLRSDYFRLMKKYIQINKKYIFASMIGIILAVAMFSSSHLIAESYKREVYSDYNLEETPALSVHRYAIKDNAEYEEALSVVKDKADELFNKYGFKISKSNTVKSFQALIPETYIDDRYYETVVESIATLKVFTYSYTKVIYDQFLTDVNFEFDKDERIALVDKEDLHALTKLDNGRYMITISTGNNEVVNGTTGFTYQGYPHMNYTVDKYVLLPEDYYERDRYWYSELGDFTDWRSILILQSDLDTDNLIDKYQKIIDKESVNEFFWGVMFTINYYIDLTGTTLDAQFSNEITKMRREFANWGYNNIGSVELTGYYHWNKLSIDSPLEGIINTQENIVISMQSISFVGNTLIAILTLFLVSFSLTMVIKRKERIISIMRIRGTEGNQVKAMLLAEFLITTAIAIFFGMLLSIPWAQLSLRTTGFLEFSDSFKSIFFPYDWFIKIPLIGLILALDINYSTINSLSLTSIEEGEIGEETKAPFWQRNYIDLTLFVISAIYWTVMPFLSFEETYLYEMFWSGIGSFVFIILLISSPLVIARFFTGSILFISKYLWKNSANITSLSFRTMQKYRFTISKLVALLMIGSLLSVITITAPATFENFEEEKNYYNIGSEMTIGNFDYNNASLMKVFEDDDIESFTEILKMSITKVEDYYYEEIREYQILGINPQTFEDTAYWDEKYDNKPLKDIMESLDDGKNNSIAGQESYLKAINQDIGENLSISFAQDSIPLTFSVKSSFDLFPNLVFSKVRINAYGGFYAHETQLLTKISTAENLMNITIPSASIIGERGVYLKLNVDANIIRISEKIKYAFPESMIYLPEDTDSDRFEESAQIVLFSMLHGLLLVFILVSIVAFAYYSFLSITERKREIGVYRALGMIHKQIFWLYFIENIVILFSGLILGTFTGFFYSGIIFMIYRGFQGYGGNTIPPIKMVIPWKVFLVFYLIIILVNLASLIIPPRFLSRKQVGSILRMD